MAVFLAAGTWWSAEIGRWTFGNGSGQRLVLSLLIAVVGQFCYTLAYSALRGLSRFRSAAALQIVGGALIPLTGVLLAAGRVERALAVSGGLWVTIGGTVFIRLYRQWAHPAPSVADIRRGARALFVFGVPRIPGEVALFGLFALPGYAAVHRNDIVGAGFLSVGLSLVQALGTVFAATGFVLLPYWSRAANNAETRLVARKRVGLLVIASTLLTALALILLQVFLPTAARLLLGPLAAAGLNQIRYVILGSVPYVAYLVLRDYFDAISVFPMNTVALTAAIIIQAALLGVHGLGVAAATSGSLLALGLLMITLWIISGARGVNGASREIQDAL
jgi:O-antigen/teichoic acid export membrane protein